MSEQILEKLFESPAKIKILKLFFRNPDLSFTMSEIMERLDLDYATCKRQINNFLSIKFLSCKLKSKKKRFFIDTKFEFLEELRSLVLKSSPASKNKMLRSVKRLGKIYLLLLAGVFIDKVNRSRCDVFIVGDNIDQKKLAKIVKNIEAEAGTQIRFSLMNLEEFKYRRDMFDKFVREVLDLPYEKLIDKIGLNKGA